MLVRMYCLSVQTLGDIQVALKVLSGGDKTESPLDRHYKGLNCTLTPVDPEDPVFALVEKYVRQTHAPTHKQYRLEVMELFEVDRQEENFKDVGNRYGERREGQRWGRGEGREGESRGGGGRAGGDGG